MYNKMQYIGLKFHETKIFTSTDLYLPIKNRKIRIFCIQN